jgi:hypothetical protein
LFFRKNKVDYRRELLDQDFNHRPKFLVKSFTGLYLLCFKRGRLRLAISSTIILYILCLSLVVIFPAKNRQMVLGDSTKAWDINTAGEYTYDDTKIEFSGGVAQLKAAATPGTDWIATDGSGNNWNYRKKIIFDNSAQAENQLNFPVLVKLDKDTDIDYAKTQNSGQDIRFTDSDGKTALKHEIERWDETGISYVWTKVPQIDASSNTDYIYLYYGNATVTDGQDTTNVWDSGFLGVWHNNESGTTVQDSTVNDKDGTKTADGHPAPTIGQIYNGQNFLGDDRIGTTINTALTDFTVEIWFKDNGVSDNGGYERLADKSYTGCFWFGRNSTTANSWGGGVREGNAPYGVFVTLTDGQWHQISSIRSGSTHYVYGDGGSVSASNNVGSTACDATNFAIGAYGDNSAQQRFGGVIDEVRLSNTARSQPWLAASYKSGKDTFNSFDPESTLYPTTSPTLVPNTGQGYSSLLAFSQTLGGGSTGTIKYQISSDNGVTWYWWSGAAWATTVAGYTEANIATDINTNIATFTNGANPKTFKWKAFLNSDGSQQPKLDAVNMTYVCDTADPDNPATLASAKSQKTGGTDIATDTWSKYTSPYFTWNEPNDNAGDGEVASGIAGYYLYFGTSATGDPHASRGIATELGGSGVHYQTDTDFEVGVDTAAIATATTYYLRIETMDNTGNIKDLAVEDLSLFIYKYDGTAPSSPLYASVSPSGYSKTNSFTFSWPIEGANAASDTGGSGLAGYQYKVNAGGWSATFNDGSKAVANAVSGVNIFYLRAIDSAENYDETPIQTNFYFSEAAPTASTGLQVDPISADENVFSFSWGLPLEYNGSIAGYYYSINALPTIANVTYTTNILLPDGPYATQQGENTLYLVAKDEAGNYDLGSCQVITGDPTIDSCARVNFTANTSAPGIPTALSAVDGSNRDLHVYKVFLTWETPASKGTGFAGYEIYRSTDGLNYISVGTTTGTTYADTELESILYYYQIKSKDNAGQYSAPSTAISITPTGRYTTPPALTTVPVTDVKSFSTIISWETDRESSSFVEYGATESAIGESKGGKTVGKLDSTTSHSLKVEGLQPNTTYYYQAVWVDSDGNQGRSGTLSFLTQIRPSISGATADNITLNTATIKWKSKTIINAVVNYCKNVSGGPCNMVRDYSGPENEDHIIQLYSLDDSSEYKFQITATDTDGNSMFSDEYFFKTLTKPTISEFRFETVDAPTTTVKLSWKTNVPTTSVATYQSGSEGVQSQSSAEYITDHTIQITTLSDKTTYVFQAKGVDQFGNSCESDKNTFTTPNDTRPPKVSEMTVEIRSSGFGETQKSQVVVAWKTDEPAASQVEYAQGISGSDYNFKTKEDSTLSTNHVVIASDLDPSKIYHLRAVSIDTALNAGYSDDTTVITGKLQKSVIDIIVNSLQTSLGWLFKIFQ